MRRLARWPRPYRLGPSLALAGDRTRLHVQPGGVVGRMNTPTPPAGIDPVDRTAHDVLLSIGNVGVHGGVTTTLTADDARRPGTHVAGGGFNAAQAVTRTVTSNWFAKLTA